MPHSTDGQPVDTALYYLAILAGYHGHAATVEHLTHKLGIGGLLAKTDAVLRAGRMLELKSGSVKATALRAIARHLADRFLPTALEVAATPLSPLGRSIHWTILPLFTPACAWATCGEVDLVAVAQGCIIPNGHRKSGQRLEIGTATAIYVVEGQTVDKCPLLIALADSRARADAEWLRGELGVDEPALARHRRVLLWQEDEDSAGINSLVADSDPFEVRLWRQLHDRLQVLAGERDRRRAEQRNARLQVDKLQGAIRELEMRAVLTHREFHREVVEHAELAPLERMNNAEIQLQDSVPSLTPGMTGTIESRTDARWSIKLFSSLLR